MEQHNDPNPANAWGTGNARLVLGLLAAVALGTGIGILVAPSRGSELRRRISESAANLPRGLVRVGRAALEEGRHALEPEPNPMRRAS